MSSSTKTINAGGSGSGVTANKNLLINGNFSVWQRVVSSSPTATVAEISAWRLTNMPADRWRIVPAGASITAAQETTLANLPSNKLSRLGLKLTGATNVTTVDVLQRLEGQDVIEGMQQTVTLSVYIYNGTGDAITPNLRVNTPTTTLDTWTTQGTNRLDTAYGSTIPNAAWTKVSWMFDASVITNATLGMEVGIRIASGVLVVGKTVTFSQFQLEVGGVVTTFERRTFAEELSLAQRYYEQMGFSAGVGFPSFQAYASASGQIFRVSFPFKIVKRTPPTITVSGTWGVQNKSDQTQPQIASDQDTVGFHMYIGPTDGVNSVGVFRNSIDDGIKFDSEL
jgi:hypothetical protein